MMQLFTRNKPPAALAKRLAREELLLHHNLIHAREASRMTTQDVADRTGWKASQVRYFEGLHSNPTLSEIRHYALAIGVFIEYHIKFSEEL